MAFTHPKNVNFSYRIFLCEVCFIDIRLFSAYVDNFDCELFASFFFYTSSHNTADTSEKRRNHAINYWFQYMQLQKIQTNCIPNKHENIALH